jgi:type IV pilus assembly protein PilV
MTPRQSPRAPRPQRGLTLIEVMISMLLLAFGLLGMLGLKATALKQTGDANSRTVASIHANDILDRMRANPVRATTGQYAIGLADPAPVGPANVAQVDLAQWRARIVEQLPGGTGSVLVQPDGTAQIVIQWNERSEQGAATRALTFTFEARL